jgi:hypothetical protein
MCLANGNVVHFTIMDHDIFMSNDFEGEACLELNQLPGIKSNLSESNSPTVFELFLTNPNGNESKQKSFIIQVKHLVHSEIFFFIDSNCQIMEALEYRETDKLAIEFIRMRRSLVK